MASINKKCVVDHNNVSSAFIVYRHVLFNYKIKNNSTVGRDNKGQEKTFSA